MHMDPRVEFFLEMLNAPTSRRAVKTVPLIREISYAARTGMQTAALAYELEKQLGGQINPDLYSPEIRRYTYSALGSTRII